MKSRLTGPASSWGCAIFGLCVLLALAAPRVLAGPAEAMTFQGYLVDANGNPLATNNPANYPVIFRIFPTSAGGSSLWSEQQIVTVDRGNFSVILSEGTPVASEPRPLLSGVMGTNGADRYVQLSVTVNGGTLDMLPRMRLLPAPYAFLSTSANQLVNPAGVAAVTYANSRVEVAGNLFASGSISGNGSGLTGLSAAQIPSLDASKITSGTLADARLSPNVPLLANNNAFVGNQTISGNLGIGTVNTTFPLTIGNNTLGDKISLWGQSGNSYGFGVQGGLLQIHSSDVNSDIAFGSGSSAAFAEGMRVTGDGKVGIGMNNPSVRLEVNGGIKMDGNNILELGANLPGKEANAGKIGYQVFTADSLEIVGAGNTPATRKVRVFAEGATEFTGGIRVRGGPPGAGGVNNNGYAFTGNGGDNDSGMFSSADGQLEFYSNNNERMRISTTGFVGIGTTAPTVPLEVRGSVSRNFTGNTVYFGLNGSDVSQWTAQVNGPRSWNVSIYAENYISGIAFIAYSDARIKQALRLSEGAQDLATIQKLRVTDYQMVDAVAHGTDRKKGFVAQEVKQVIPEAVTVSSNFVPDIFANAQSATVHRATGTMTVQMAKAHGLHAGDKVRLLTDETSQDLVVSKAVTETEFEVERVSGDPQRVFVYGREVPDFMAVDYSRIFTTGIGAIQELAKKVEELESRQARLAELDKAAGRAAVLDKENAELRGRLEQQDKRLAALENLLQQKLNGLQQAGAKIASQE